jgi:O-antigen ligase
LFSVAIAFVNNPRIVLLPVVAMVGVAIMLIFLRRPQIGILAMAFSSLLVPALYSRSETSRLDPAIVIEVMLVGFWVLDMIARDKRIYIAPTRVNLPLILFSIWALISLINGQINYYIVTKLASLFAKISQIAIFILSGVALLLAGNRLRSMVWLQRLTWLFIILCGVYIVWRLIPPIKPYVFRVFQEGSDASIFWVWLVAILTSQILLNRQLSQRVRLALGALLIATLYIALIEAYSWKSGWVPALIALAVIVFIGFPRFRAVAVFLGIVVMILGLSRIGNLVSGGEDYSISTRSVAWRLILDIVKVNPILGLGPANIYWYTPLFPILGYTVNYNSHNNYIDIIAQLGIVGLVLFLWLAWEIGVLGWRLKDVAPEGFGRAYAIGALGGLAGMLVSGFLGDWFYPFVYNVGLVGYRSSMLGWLFLGGLVLLEQLYLRNGNEEALEGS